MNERERIFYVTLDKDILATQLLDVAIVLIEHIQKYAKENGIILGESHTLNRLLKEAQNLLEESVHVSQTFKSRKLLSDELLQGKESDEDFTEPAKVRLISKHNGLR